MAALQPGSYAIESVTLKKYLLYTNERINNLHNVLQFDGQDFRSPNAHFQVENDEENPDLVHIKSNGHYLTRTNPDDFWIVAGANMTHRDQNSWACTLFRPEKVVEPNTTTRQYRFYHVQLKHYLQPFFDNDHHALLQAYQSAPTDNQILNVIDVEPPE